MERLIEKLEEHFKKMDISGKLQKRENEIAEIENICEDFDMQLSEIEDCAKSDLSKLSSKD